MKVLVDYPSKANEQKVMQLVRAEQQQKYLACGEAKEKPAEMLMLSQQDIATCWQEISAVYVAPGIEDYIVNLMDMTRHPPRQSAQGKEQNYKPDEIKHDLKKNQGVNQKARSSRTASCRRPALR
jgi:MoxR-like ATPase